MLVAAWMLFANALSGCVSGGEEWTRADDTYYVNLIRWEAIRSDGSSAKADCMLMVNDYADRIRFAAEVGEPITLTETFSVFPMKYEEYQPHHGDDAYWCAKSGGRQLSSIRNPQCWTTLEPDETVACASTAGIVAEITEAEILPPGSYPDDAKTLWEVDGFRMTLKILGKGKQCVEQCGTVGDYLAFTVE